MLVFPKNGRTLLSLAIFDFLAGRNFTERIQTYLDPDALYRLLSLCSQTAIESVEIANADDISYETNIKAAQNINDLDLESIGEKVNISISENSNGFINYLFINKTPSKTTTYRSGDNDEIYSVISMAVRSDTTAGVDESMDNGDIALWGRIGACVYHRLHKRILST